MSKYIFIGLKKRLVWGVSDIEGDTWQWQWNRFGGGRSHRNVNYSASIYAMLALFALKYLPSSSSSPSVLPSTLFKSFCLWYLRSRSDCSSWSAQPSKNGWRNNSLAVGRSLDSFNKHWSMKSRKTSEKSPVSKIKIDERRSNVVVSCK